MKKTAFTIIGWLISVILIVSLFAKLDLAEIWHGLLAAKWTWLIFAAVINMIVMALKAYRWQCLMKPSSPIKFWPIFKATMIGYAGNNVLPARGGDWYKIYLLGKQTGTSKSALTSITGLDKLFDGLSLVLLFGILSLHSRFPIWVQKGTTTVSIVILVSLVICILLLIHHRKTSEDDAENLGTVRRIAKRFGSGFDALTDHRLVIITFVNSLAICLLQVATIWSCQLAFGQHLDIWVPALVYVAINLAITIPSAPSGVGPFEAAAVLAYSWLHVNKEVAFDIAIMYHAIQFLPVTITGFIFYFKDVRGLISRPSYVSAQNQ